MKAFIFIGPSGSGKGTQVKKLEEYLKENNHGDICSLESGSAFREFITGEKFLQKRSHELYKLGKRQPDFLAVHMWADLLMESYTGQENVIFDGTPRSLNEARILDTALRFLRVDETYVIFLDVKREVARERLSARGRGDDDPYGIEKRLDWYEEDVLPAVEYYREHEKHTFIELDGGKDVDAVWEDIKKNL